MGDPQRSGEVGSQPGASAIVEGDGPKLFSGPPPEPSHRGRTIAVAVAAALLLLIAGAFLLRSGKPAAPAAQNTVLPADPYAPSLVFSQLAMSQSTSLSGGTSTFIDGQVKNTGPATVTGVTMQVLFRNDVGLAPQVETLPLTLIRTHEPYVDTEPVSAAPLKPGDEAEFRLIIETVSGNWNQELPELIAVKVARR